jgi:peptide deformylase
MAVKPVLSYPHPSLKQKITDSTMDKGLLTLVLADLIDTMNQHEGCVGLAAPQIDHPQRCVIVDVSRSPRAGENHGLLKLIHPVILEASQWKVSREGCLSFPNLLANVKRAQKVKFSSFNEKLEPLELVSVGFEAVAIQHELDHLDGILFLDRIRSSKDLFERRNPASSL